MPANLIFRILLGGFLAGIATASFFAFPSALVWVLAGVGACSLLVRNSKSVAVGCAALAFVVGLVRADVAFSRVSGIEVGEAEVSLDGFVDGDFELTASGRGKFKFQVMPSGERIIVYGPDWVRPRYGQQLTLTGKLREPQNTGDFDYVSYLAKEDIHAQMSFPAYGVPEHPTALPLAVRCRSVLVSMRDAVGESIGRAVPEPAAGYIGGILLGTRGTLEPALRDAFARTGTSHIMAISGYNITIVAAALMAAFTPLGRRRSFWLAVLGIFLFVVMVGASASVVRAGIMGVLALAARQMGRPAHAGTAILASGAIMAAHNPFVLRWDVGFQLSFLAVAGIVYVEPLIRPFLKRLKHEPFIALISATLAAQVMVLPLILYDFGTLAVYTLPVNLLVLPLVPVAMALGLVTGLVGLAMPFLGAMLGQVAWLVSAIQLAVVGFAANLPAAAVQVTIGAPMLVAAYAGLAAFLISRYRGLPEPTTNPVT